MESTLVLYNPDMHRNLHAGLKPSYRIIFISSYFTTIVNNYLSAKRIYVFWRTCQFNIDIGPVLLSLLLFSCNIAGSSRLLTTTSRSPSLSKSAYTAPLEKVGLLFPTSSPISANFTSAFVFKKLIRYFYFRKFFNQPHIAFIFIILFYLLMHFIVGNIVGKVHVVQPFWNTIGYKKIFHSVVVKIHP